MKVGAADQQALYRNIVHVLEHGLRTATYKLATLTALVDYSVAHRPILVGSALDVPIPELARRVIELYWRQAEPFAGIQLRQSTQSSSIILASVNAIRVAAGANDGMSLKEASRLSPEVFRRALDGVGMCLARQPLPRLQRLPGSARSPSFLFDDSFLHDNITRSELQRHNNAIRLRPGVAECLAMLDAPLRRRVQSMWIDDVLRMNRLPQEQRQELGEHLFGNNLLSAEVAKPPATRDPNEWTPDEPLVTGAFAARLNELFYEVCSPEGQPYSSGEAAAKIRESGFPMTVSMISQLRAGLGPTPSQPTVDALAQFFGVSPRYLLSGDTTPRGTSDKRPVDAREHADTREQGGWGRVVEDDLNDVAAACEVDSNGCWLAPSNSAVRCRPRGDTRDPLDLPKIPLHRWAWMVANGHSRESIPTYLIQIRRKCSNETCCNPSHLSPTVPGGQAELTDAEVSVILNKSYISSANRRETPLVETADSARTDSRVLTDDLNSIAEYCFVDASGCWIAPTLNPVSCRATGDNRSATELPRMKPQRWAWMVANGCASNPLPGNLFQVWKHCGKSNCCNPDHLFLVDPDGEESSAAEAEEWLRRNAVAKQHTVDSSKSSTYERRYPDDFTSHRRREPAASSGGRHHATDFASDDSRSTEAGAAARPPDATVVAERLNALFLSHRHPLGREYTSADVATSLQEEGFAVSESLVSRVRTGSGVLPSPQTIEALAYFFNVDSDYFTAGTHSKQVTHTATAQPNNSREGESRFVYPRARRQIHRAEAITMSVADLGRIVTGLSEAISDCLARNPAQVEKSAQLTLLLARVGALLSTPAETKVISRPLLLQIVEEWRSVGQVTYVQRPILPLLTQLLGDEDE